MKKIVDFIKKYTLISFVVAIAVLFGIILIGNAMRSVDSVVEEAKIPTKEVSVVTIEDAQYVNISGKIEKDGVITLRSHASGIVHSVYVKEGKSVLRGNRIAYVSDTYSGGSVASVAHEITTRQAQTQQETFEKRMGIIDDSRDDIRKTNDLEAEIARKQYTLQKRNTELEHDITILQNKQSALNASLRTPVTPITGTIERVFISQGDVISAGDKIAVVNAEDKQLNVIVQIDDALASVIDIDTPSILYINGNKVEVTPNYLSQSATDNQSYVITYILDDKYAKDVTNNEFIEIAIPINTHATPDNLLVPLDAVHLMSEKSIIFVIENERVVAHEIIIGDIVGGFVTVSGDIKMDDLIILNRNVFEGDLVSVIE